MVIDTSALVAMVLREDERFIFEDIVLRSPTAVMSVVSLVETTIVLLNKRRGAEAASLDATVEALRIDVRNVDSTQGMLARSAFSQYGRGHNPAALNFGDCFVYALAKVRDDTLLFKGNDFSKTDVVPAWRP